MIDFLKTVWSSYKSLIWWKQVLLLIPLIVLALICGSLFFVRVERDESLASHIKHQQRQVDKRIRENKKRQDALKKKEQDITKQQKIMSSQIRRNEKKAAKTVKDIDKAVKNNDIAELEKIRQRINRK